MARRAYAAAQPHFSPDELGSYANDYSTYVVEGVINKLPDYQDAQTVLTIDVQQIRLLLTSSWKPVHGQLLVTLIPGGAWHYGDRVELRGELWLPASDTSSAYRQYLAGQGIYVVMREPQAGLIQSGQGNPILRAIYSIKEHAQAVVRRIYPDPEASLVEGILLGNASGLSQDVADAFRATSTTHIIAISGFNIGIVSALFSTLFVKLLGMKRRLFGCRTELQPGSCFTQSWWAPGLQ